MYYIDKKNNKNKNTLVNMSAITKKRAPMMPKEE